MFALLTIVVPLCMVALAVLGYRRLRRRRLARALGPEQRATFARIDAEAQRLARKRPWQPIRFALDDVAMEEGGFRLRAAGTDGARPFGFGLSFVMQQGPVAVCDWWRTGDESDAFLDILARFADAPRGDRRFADLVRASASVLYAKPNNVPIPRIAAIESKVVFERAENQPELYLNFDFANGTGHILEKDVHYRGDLVDAFGVQPN
ncbi:MAG TPA: hypothetical protein VLX44_09480 [Xanthobacteraceae bacterium]|nr:hypothetical protein [Xanthobacteraceae bacterium]